MRERIALLGKSKVVLAVLIAAVLVAVAGTGIGYASLNKEVTLSLDGETRSVETFSGTVGDVLEEEGIEVGKHDIVAPGVDEEVDDGTRISIRFGRELTLNVDGTKKTYWVNSDQVGDALAEIDRRLAGAELSASRSATIARGGMTLRAATPKKLQVKVGAADRSKREVAGFRVADVLEELEYDVDKNDIVKPAPKTKLREGMAITVTKVRVARKRVEGESIDFETVEKSDDSMYEDESETVTEGREGARNVTYRLTFHNGELQATKVLRQKVIREPVDEVVRVGTKEREEPAPNYAGGSTVWDQLAQCESGGNWSINTGNGYYGGLQFNASTWHAYGGSGLPHQNSREEQIRIAEKVRAATGGYGSWPACSASLGLPQ